MVGRELCSLAAAKCGVHFCCADGWAAATTNGKDWVEFQFSDDVLVGESNC